MYRPLMLLEPSRPHAHDRCRPLRLFPLRSGAGMIVCSCSGVTDQDIRQAIAWMRASDPYALITPGKIYRALGKSAECGGCIRLFVEQMRGDDNLAVPVGLRRLRGHATRAEGV
jgi:bacterioferritin-associated ferredoxin